MTDRVKHALTTCCAIGCFMVLAIPTFFVGVISWLMFGRGQ